MLNHLTCRSTGHAVRVEESFVYITDDVYFSAVCNHYRHVKTLIPCTTV